MTTRMLRHTVVLLSATACLWTSALGQAMDPAQMIQRAQRTKVAPANRLRPTSKPISAPAPARSRIASFIARSQQLPAQVVTRQDPEPAREAAVQRAPAPVPADNTPVLSIRAFAIATLLAVFGTAGIFALARRMLRQKPVRMPAPVTVTPFDRPEPPVKRDAIVEDGIDGDTDPESDLAPGFARGRGEIELAQTIERLKQRMQIAEEPRTRRPSQKKRPRGAEAARRMRTGKGELDLAYRLEQLREKHYVMEEQQ